MSVGEAGSAVSLKPLNVPMLCCSLLEASKRLSPGQEDLCCVASYCCCSVSGYWNRQRRVIFLSPSWGFNKNVWFSEKYFLKNISLVSLNKLKAGEKDPFLFLWNHLEAHTDFRLYFHYFSSGWRKKKVKYLQKEKKRLLLVFSSQKDTRVCFLLVSKQILLLEDFSPSVIKSFMLKQYKKIQSVMLCHPPSVLAVLQALFGALLWKWNFLVGSLLAYRCVRPVSFLGV